jgi:hypothetical protein
MSLHRQPSRVATRSRRPAKLLHPCQEVVGPASDVRRRSHGRPNHRAYSSPESVATEPPGRHATPAGVASQHACHGSVGRSVRAPRSCPLEAPLPSPHARDDVTPAGRRVRPTFRRPSQRATATRRAVTRRGDQDRRPARRRSQPDADPSSVPAVASGRRFRLGRLRVDAAQGRLPRQMPQHARLLLGSWRGGRIGALQMGAKNGSNPGGGGARHHQPARRRAGEAAPPGTPPHHPPHRTPHPASPQRLPHLRHDPPHDRRDPYCTDCAPNRATEASAEHRAAGSRVAPAGVRDGWRRRSLWRRAGPG